jgi:hypothetical protein
MGNSTANPKGVIFMLFFADETIHRKVIWHLETIRVSHFLVDGVEFEVTSFFQGGGNLSELLLAAARAKLNKSVKSTNLSCKEGVGLCYNDLGS